MVETHNRAGNSRTVSNINYSIISIWCGSITQVINTPFSSNNVLREASSQPFNSILSSKNDFNFIFRSDSRTMESIFKYLIIGSLLLFYHSRSTAVGGCEIIETSGETYIDNKPISLDSFTRINGNVDRFHHCVWLKNDNNLSQWTGLDFRITFANDREDCLNATVLIFYKENDGWKSIENTANSGHRDIYTGRFRPQPNSNVCIQ